MGGFFVLFKELYEFKIREGGYENIEDCLFVRLIFWIWILVSCVCVDKSKLVEWYGLCLSIKCYVDLVYSRCLWFCSSVTKILQAFRGHNWLLIQFTSMESTFNYLNLLLSFFFYPRSSFRGHPLFLWLDQYRIYFAIKWCEPIFSSISPYM